MRNAHSLKILQYMKTPLFRFLLSVALLLMQATNSTAGGPISIQKFGVPPENTPQANREALQRAIDMAEKSGTALYVENPKACIQAVACIDNNEEPFNLLP